MIFVSISEKTLQACLKEMRGHNFVEFRLERIKLNDGDIGKLFSTKSTICIATCRPGNLSNLERKRRLIEAIESGASYVDIEVDAPKEIAAEVIQKAKNRKCKVIVSYHDFNKTPQTAKLEKIVDWCFTTGADIAKIACKVNSPRDAARLLGLLASNKDIAVIGMGQKGKIVRVAAPFLGSKISYVSSRKGKETASGQLTKSEMQKIMKVIKSV
ncbi:MAG: type I 3-dehydroquinate dehydratase [Candidatus Anstonellaceae archaeon]